MSKFSGRLQNSLIILILISLFILILLLILILFCRRAGKVPYLLHPHADVRGGV